MTDDDIYRYYLGEVVIGDMYNSPIPGRDDSTPSFRLYEKDGRVRWNDFGLTDQYGRDVENLVQYLRFLPLTDKGYGMAKSLIRREVRAGMVGQTLTKLRRREPKDYSPFVRDRSFKDFELAYWKRFDIGKDILEFEDITPLDSLSWSGVKGTDDIVSTPSDPGFIYWWDRNPASWKIYRPLQPKRTRFRQDNIDGVIEGWESMKLGFDLLGRKFRIMIINSSTKDRLVTKNLLGMEYNALNPRGESDREDIIAAKDEIESLAEIVLIVYDSDEAGFVGSMKMASFTNWTAVDMRGKLDGNKDVSDFVDTERGNHSYNELFEVFKQHIL